MTKANGRIPRIQDQIDSLDERLEEVRIAVARLETKFTVIGWMVGVGTPLATILVKHLL